MKIQREFAASLGACLAFAFIEVSPPVAERSLAEGTDISRFFDRGYGQIEVGGKYAGAEFHRSRPLPSRISLYYPVANSIDLSTDYWRRYESQPMAVGIRKGQGERHWIGRGPWPYVLSPEKVRFAHEEDGLSWTIAYRFCYTEPAMVFVLTMKNVTRDVITAEIYTHLRPTLRTCQTYARFDSAWTGYDAARNALAFHFDERQADFASVIVQNAGLSPSSWTSSAAELSVTDSGTSSWIHGHAPLERRLIPRGSKAGVVAAFLYDVSLKPGASVSIVQVIGSCRAGEVLRLTRRLLAGWRSDVEAYEGFVRERETRQAITWTGDTTLDHAARWARGILATNAHWIDGPVVPMPCPAEYNFFFTHDVLMTDLAGVNFDLQRVRRDLLYIIAHAKDNIIPHAYYWRDDGFKTEYCTPENWNHLWFIIVSASYVRHSMDDATGRLLYPLVTKSVTEMLRKKGEDDLMHAFSPDWWDIGHRDGPRAYTTLLAVRALREYLFLSSFLKKFSPALITYERQADSMRRAVESRLWDEGAGYLVNFNGNDKDAHYYMGSLVGAAFGLLSPAHAERLVETASKVLVDPLIGVRTVMPADFHTDSARTYFGFVDNEAGNSYLYLNGAVWAHDNAWYILALRETGRPDDALRFCRQTMTVDGIINSPMGQPAMYEYRSSDAASADFGAIDKPSFLWAGGFYLYALYHLLGVDEHEWNLSIAGPAPAAFDSTAFTLSCGAIKTIEVVAAGVHTRRITADGREVPSRVIPLSLGRSRHWKVLQGKTASPRLERLDAILQSATFDGRAGALRVECSSFDGHPVIAVVDGVRAPKSVTLEGKRVTDWSKAVMPDGSVRIEISFNGSSAVQTLTIKY